EPHTTSFSDCFQCPNREGAPEGVTPEHSPPAPLSTARGTVDTVRERPDRGVSLVQPLLGGEAVRKKRYCRVAPRRNVSVFFLPNLWYIPTPKADKGKPGESLGRKATGLRPAPAG